jgi:hypothetical protein
VRSCITATILFFVFTCTRSYSMLKQDYITMLPDEPKKAIIYRVIESVYAENRNKHAENEIETVALKSLIAFAQLSRFWYKFIAELPLSFRSKVFQLRYAGVQRKSKYNQLEQLLADTDTSAIWGYNILIGRRDDEKCRAILINLALKKLLVSVGMSPTWADFSPAELTQLTHSSLL